MKNFRLLLAIPFIALCSCQGQKEIKEEKAKEIIQQIRNNKNDDPFIFNATNKGAIGKGKEKIEIDLTYVYKYTSNSYYTYLKGFNGGTKYDIEMYCVKGTKHGDVKYARYFDDKQNEYVKSVSASKYNEDYETAYKDLGAYRVIGVLDYYLQVQVVDTPLDEYDTLKYYSSKEGQLTIELTTDLKNYNGDDEVTKTNKSIYKYEDNRFVEFDDKSTSTYDNPWDGKGSMDYETKLTIELPSDWENYLRLEA